MSIVMVMMIFVSNSPYGHFLPSTTKNHRSVIPLIKGMTENIEVNTGFPLFEGMTMDEVVR
jgi:hypothetical protein